MVIATRITQIQPVCQSHGLVLLTGVICRRGVVLLSVSVFPPSCFKAADITEYSAKQSFLPLYWLYSYHDPLNALKI